MKLHERSSVSFSPFTAVTGKGAWIPSLLVFASIATVHRTRWKSFRRVCLLVNPDPRSWQTHGSEGCGKPTPYLNNRYISLHSAVVGRLDDEDRLDDIRGDWRETEVSTVTVIFSRTTTLIYSGCVRLQCADRWSRL